MLLLNKNIIKNKKSRFLFEEEAALAIITLSMRYD